VRKNLALRRCLAHREGARLGQAKTEALGLPREKRQKSEGEKSRKSEKLQTVREREKHGRGLDGTC